MQKDFETDEFGPNRADGFGRPRVRASPCHDEFFQQSGQVGLDKVANGLPANDLPRAENFSAMRKVVSDDRPSSSAAARPFEHGALRVAAEAADDAPHLSYRRP